MMIAGMRLTIKTLCFFAMLPVMVLSSQTRTLDSLKHRLANTASVEKRKDLFIAICSHNQSMPADSLLKYIRAAEKINTSQGVEFSRKIEVFRINYLIKAGRFRQAVNVSDSLLKNREFKDSRIIYAVQTEKCRALIRDNQSLQAIEVLFNMLKQAENTRDTGTVIQAYVLLGWANMELEKYAEAIKWLDKGCRYTDNEKYFTAHASLFMNIASCYNNINKMDTAMQYINKALFYARKGENLTMLANSLNIRADIFLKKGQQDRAQKDLEEALFVRELLGDPYYVLSDMGQLAFFYASNGQYQKGIDIAIKGAGIAEKGKQYQKLIYLYSALAENYRMNGEEGKRAQTLSRIIALKDTIYHNNSEKAIAELEGKYEYEKNRNTIIQQQYALSKSRYILAGSVILLLLSVVLFVLIYKNYQHVQRRKLEYILHEQKLLSEAAVLTAEENERKRIAADLHDSLGAHAAAISSNVRYLREEIIDRDELVDILDENASGMVNHLNDTIWVLKNEKLYLTNLGDRFKLWLKRLLVNYPDMRYHVHETIDHDIELSPNKILHLFMLLKESVNNAIKHSHCKDLSIYFRSGEHWEIIIEDNGTGFDRSATYSGNGLDNMRQRAAECGWSIRWESVTEGGTRVIIQDTLN
jgi:signal transduction histidine kinase